MGSFAGHLLMVLAGEVDKRESESVSERVVELSESLIGGRTTLEYAPELRLLGSALYYGCTIFSSGGTPGQQLCGLCMIVPLPVEKTAAHSSRVDAPGDAPKNSWLQLLRNWQNGLFSSTASSATDNVAYGRPRWKTNMTVVLLLALFPYIKARLRKGTALIEHMVQVIVAPEHLAPPQQQPQPPQSPSILTDLPTSSPNLLRKLYAALKSSWLQTTNYYAQQSGSGGRCEGLLSFLSDVHFLAFLKSSGGNGFLHLALRVAGVRLMTLQVAQQSQSAQGRIIIVQPPVGLLKWLFLTRLTLLVAYTARVFMQQYSMANELIEMEEESEAARNRIVVPIRQEADVGPSSWKCPLCMDLIHQPATTPCGHMYCWSCLQGLCVQASRGNGGDARCPVCRTRFQAQQVRAIYFF